MAELAQILLKGKSGPFVGGDLVAREIGLDTTNEVIYVSVDGIVVKGLGAEGPQGPQGDTGPAPSGTGFVKVIDGALQTPSPTLQFSAGNFAANGDAQGSILIARNSTTNATQTELFLDGSLTRCVIAADTTWFFKISLIARRTDADNESAAYTFEGALDRNANTTAFVGTVNKTVIAEDAAAWDATVEADDINDALVIKVTGENSKTIRWVAKIELVEVSG